MKALSLLKQNEISDLGYRKAVLHSDGLNGFLNSLSAGTDHSAGHHWGLRVGGCVLWASEAS